MPEITDHAKIHGFCIIRVELDDKGDPVDWTFLNANEELALIEGKPLDQLIGHRFYEIFPDGSRKWLRHYYEAAYLGKSIGFDDISDEIGLYLHVEVYPIGQPGCCACVVCDIKENIFARLKQQEEQREQKTLLQNYEAERLRNIKIRHYAQALDIVFPLVISLDYLNDHYDMVEYDNFYNKSAAYSGTIDELIRVGASTIPDPDMAETFWNLFNKEAVIKAFQQGRRELSLRHPQNGDDGKVHYMDTHVICTECSKDKITAVSMAKCIDEEAERDYAMKAASDHAAVINALATIYTTIIEADLVTHGYKVIQTNSPIIEVMGGEAQGNFDEVMEAVLKYYMHPDDIDRMREFVNLATVSERMGSDTSLMTEYRAPYGKWFECRFIVKNRDEENRVVSAIYAARDVTPEKLKELSYREQLQAVAQEAEKANKAKTDFLLRMSHDIRTPLNGIRGMLDIADHFDGDLDKLRECRNKIRESSNILLELINEVLDMSKLESGETVLERVPFDLSHISGEVFTVIEKLAEEQDIQVIEDCNVQHSNLIGSPIHFKRILLNILGNAIKYNRPHGKVYISCHEVSFDGKTLELETVVRDTGIGMSEEFQRHLFEPFQQENANVRTKYGGTGLGLSIAKSLVEKMGGTVVCESKRDVGTTFTIQMPFEVDLADHVEEKEISEEDASIAGYKIILAEDNELNMEIAHFLLELAGATILEAHNGQEAVDAFATSKPGEISAILMDLMMPVMDGYEATRLIRAMDRPDASVPIIAMTANAFVEDRIATKKAGMNAHIAKPLNAQKVVSIIAHQVKSR